MPIYKLFATVLFAVVLTGCGAEPVSATNEYTAEEKAAYTRAFAEYEEAKIAADEARELLADYRKEYLEAMDLELKAMMVQVDDEAMRKAKLIVQNYKNKVESQKMVSEIMQKQFDRKSANLSESLR
ncbi:MAG: hypothetical protein WBD31_32015 [Rubripirellula sp.]